MAHCNARLTPRDSRRIGRTGNGWMAPGPKWVYLRPYYSNRERLDALPRFLAYSNHRRPHGTRRGYSRLTPVNNVLGNYT